MFELLSPTTAQLKSVTPREEIHGDEKVVAVTLRFEIVGVNTFLDNISPTLRRALFKEIEDQEQLPGVEPATPLLVCADVKQVVLSNKYDGWVLRVAHGIDDETEIVLGDCKVDKFKVEPMEGGTTKTSFNIGTNDIDAEELGLLCGKLGSEIEFTLKAPEPKADPIDGTTGAFEKDHPGADDQGRFDLLDDGDDDYPGEGREPAANGDATDEFIAQHG
jgi:hypothetical protein